MKRAAALLLCGIAAAASARNADGTLGAIATPNDGQPAFTTPGGAFTVTARAETNLSIERDGLRIDLETAWSTDAGHAVAACTLPADAPPGLYAIEARQGDDLIDRTPRAVHVREAGESAAYVFRCVANPRVGSDGAAWAESLAALSNQPGAFILITGNLTATGADAEFSALLAALGACGKPTVVCPGPNDGAAFGRYFAGGPQGFAYGRDGFLILDGRWTAAAVDAFNDPGAAHVLRRSFKPGRWTVAALGAGIDALGMRAQLDLFADDPVDALLLPGGADGAEPFFPWGATEVIALPSGERGPVHTVRANPSGLALIGPPSSAD